MNRTEILSILRKYKRNNAGKYGIIELGIFGSTARGDAGFDSDVDICIKTNTPNPFFLVHIKEDLEGLINRHVDIVRVRDRMNPYLRERIEKEGRYV
jgi:predicted nucleotidyltransferase